MKKKSTSTVRRKQCETSLYGRIFVKKPWLRKQNNVKKLQWVKMHKDWKIEQWNKILWADKSKFEIFWSNQRVCVQQSVGERAATSCITLTIKHERGSIMVLGAFANCKVEDLHQWSANWIRLVITAYCSIMWSHLEHGLWLKDLYSCKIMPQSILVTGHWHWLECLPMAWETWVQFQVESYQRLKKWYLMPPCLTLRIIRYGSRVKWSYPGKGVAPSPNTLV